MDSFFEDEAEVASSDGESVEMEHSDEEIKQKRKGGKKRKRVVHDSDDEEGRVLEII